MRNISTKKAWLVLSGLAVALAAVVSLDAAESPLDDGFKRLRIGMTPQEVEAIFGPSRPHRNPDADRNCVLPLDDFDGPPLEMRNYQFAFWYNGVKQRVRVIYLDGKLYEAKINHPGVDGVYLQ